jgi:nicotinate-nucleotide adenylyltransferase
MVRRAIEGNPHFALSLTEMNEEGYTYTFRTLETLREQNPDTEYYFIIGADSLYSFDTWMEPGRICQACTMVVATRNHTPIDELNKEIEAVSGKYHGQFLRLDTMNIDVSSQLLRNWVKENKSLRYYVPDQVISYIREHHIYLTQDEDE